jgi:hypothetical protein
MSKRKARDPVATLPPIRERDILSACLDALKMLGVEAERQNCGGFHDAKGHRVYFGKGKLDIAAQLPDGRKLEIEVKRPGKKPTEEQWRRIRQINRDNGCAFWVNDSAQVMHAVGRLLEGWWVEIEDDGHLVVTDGKE